MFKSCNNFSCDTMSNALLRSIWTRRVLFAGFFSLKPPATDSTNSCRAVTVECFDLKPCWMSGTGRCVVRVGSRTRSRILIAGHRSDTGRYEVDSSAGLPGFSSGIILDDFQMSGMVLVVSDRLKSEVRYLIPNGPRCLRCIVAMLSGPNARDALACFIALLRQITHGLSCLNPIGPLLF